jgi:hypothetical protein
MAWIIEESEKRQAERIQKPEKAWAILEIGDLLSTNIL